MTRIVSKFGIAAALTLGMIATAAAQGTGRQTPPTKKVPITKEAPGEVVPIHDTVTVTTVIHDTVTRYRRDTLTVTGPTVTRFDTVITVQTPGWLNRGNGLYFGLGAGTQYGNGGLAWTTIPGYVFQGNLGYDTKGPLGVRLTASLARPDEQGWDASLGGRPEVSNITGDLKLRLPFFSGSKFPMFGLYAVGGADFSIFRDLAQRAVDGSISISQPGKLDSELGWNLGGGATVELGHSRQLFLEARMISFHMDNYQRSGQMPIVLGMNWY